MASNDLVLRVSIQGAEKAVATAGELEAAIAELRAEEQRLIDKTRELDSAMGGVEADTSALAETESSLKEVRQELGRVTAEFKGMEKAQASLDKAFSTNPVERFTAELEEATQKSQQFRAAVDQYSGSFDGVSGRVDGLDESLKGLREGEFAAFGEAVESARSAGDELGGALEGVGEKSKEAAGAAAENIGGKMSENIEKAKEISEGLGGDYVKLAQTLTKLGPVGVAALAAVTVAAGIFAKESRGNAEALDKVSASWEAVKQFGMDALSNIGAQAEATFTTVSAGFSAAINAISGDTEAAARDIREIGEAWDAVAADSVDSIGRSARAYELELSKIRATRKKFLADTVAEELSAEREITAARAESAQAGFGDRVKAIREAAAIDQQAISRQVQANQELANVIGQQLVNKRQITQEQLKQLNDIRNISGAQLEEFTRRVDVTDEQVGQLVDLIKQSNVATANGTALNIRALNQVNDLLDEQRRLYAQVSQIRLQGTADALEFERQYVTTAEEGRRVVDEIFAARRKQLETERAVLGSREEDKTRLAEIANELRALERERLSVIKETDEAIAALQTGRVERERIANQAILDDDRRTFDERLAANAKVFDLQQQAVRAELELLARREEEQGRLSTEELARRQELDNQLLDLSAQREQAELGLRREAAQKQLELAAAAVDREFRLAAARSEQQNARLERAAAEAGRQIERAAVPADAVRRVEEAGRLIRELYAARARAAEEAAQAELRSLESARENLQRQMEDGLIAVDDFREQLAELETQETEITVRLKTDLEANAAELDAEVRALGDTLRAKLNEYLADPLAASLKKSLMSAFSLSPEDAQLVADQLGKLGAAASEALGKFFEFRSAALQRELDYLDNQGAIVSEKIGRIDERLNELNGLLGETEERIAEIGEELTDAVGSRREFLIQQLEQERATRQELTDQVAAEEASKAALAAKEQQIAQAQAALAKEQAVIGLQQAKVQQLIAATGNVATIASLAQALSAGVAGATRSAAQASSVAGPAAPAVFAATLAATGAQVIALIANIKGIIEANKSIKATEQNFKDLESGNLTFAGGGRLYGPLHSQGGIRGTGRFANVEVEGGEFVVNRVSTAKHLGLLEAINADRGGRFETGGLLPDSGGDAAAAISRLTEGVFALARRPVTVGVDEISRVQQRVAVIEANAQL